MVHQNDMTASYVFSDWMADSNSGKHSQIILIKNSGYF